MDQKSINREEWKKSENWSLGFYFSKRDSRVWVPKAVPWMGWTINIGQKGGALWLIAFLVGIPLLIVLLTVISPT